MARATQLGLVMTMCLALINAQGDEHQFPFLTGRAAGPGPSLQANDRYYWMPPQQQLHHPFPAMANFPHFGPQPQPFGQNIPLYLRNYYNPNPLPYNPPPVNQLEFDRDPTIILMPPNELPNLLPTHPTPSTTVASTVSETQSTEEQSETEASNATADPNNHEESERSGELMRSETSGFTNAHHYPFPIGLWSQYKKSMGLDEPNQKVEEKNDETSPVNPRRFPSILLLQPNQMSFVNTQRHFPDWSYGRPHSGAQFPANLVRVPDPGNLYDARKIGPIGDSQYQYFAVPLRSVLNQMNTEIENERV